MIEEFPDTSENNFRRMTHRSRENGSFYRVVAMGYYQSKDGTDRRSVIFQDESNQFWIWPEEEFRDGRMERLK